MMKKLSVATITLAIALIFAACSNNEKVILTGKYQGDKKGMLYLNRIDINTPVFIDSIKINKSGTFKTSLRHNEPAFYTLGFNTNDFITVIAYPGDRINLEFTGNNLKSGYQVSGSKETRDIQLLDKKLSETLIKLDSLTSEYEKPGALEEDARKKELEEQYTQVIQEQRKYNIAYILDNLNSFSSIKALYQRLNENAYVLYKPTDAQYLKLVSDTLNAHYPDSKQAKALAKNLQNELSSLNVSRLSGLAQNIEPVDMDLNFKDINGNRIRLSSFEGKKYVLLTFWSASSKECVSNNLRLKSFYSKYKSGGFEIYQVNLDEDEDLWRRSVKFDDLPWVNVREENPANPESAVKYNITSVPANYLINKEGEIIAKNLFGRNLQIKLSQLFD